VLRTAWEPRLPGITQNPRPNRRCFFSNSLYWLAPPPEPLPADPPRLLLPAPLLPAPLLPVEGLVVEGLVVEGLVVDGLVLVLSDDVPPAPAPARLSRRHFSRSVPVRPTQLLGTLVEAPLAAESLVLGVLPGVPLAPPLMPTPGRSLAPVVLLPAEPLPPALEPDDAPLEPLEPEPEPEPEPCAKAAVDRARSAAAVAAVRVLSIMVMYLLEVMGDCKIDCEVFHARAMPENAGRAI
jgi:hypothetical protein